MLSIDYPFSFSREILIPMGDYVIQEIASLLNLDSTTRTKALQYFN